MAAGSLMISSFKDASTKKLVIVIINMGTESRNLQLNSSVKTKNNMLNSYLTDASNNLKRSTMTTDNIVINAKSVVTLTGEYQ
jgi:alpha-L-arabinofuranosidase